MYKDLKNIYSYDDSWYLKLTNLYFNNCQDTNNTRSNCHRHFFEIFNEPFINQQIISKALYNGGDFRSHTLLPASAVSVFVSENKFVLRIMDEVVAESRNVFSGNVREIPTRLCN